MRADAGYIAQALVLAERGRGTTSPNPMVGAVVVNGEGVVVGRGAHAFAGGPHAEVLALADAGPQARGATLYCTLEPCSHTGRTGPCAPRVVAAGIRRVVLSMQDPNPLVSGAGIALLRAQGLAVTVGVLEAEARRLNAPFLTAIESGRPHVTMKAALSADSKVALAGSRPVRLTGEVANRRVHRDRAEVDAIVVGSGTLLLDDPLLTARGAYRGRPLARVILDRRLRSPPTARVLSTIASGPVIIVTCGPETAGREARISALSQAGATVYRVPDDLPGFEAAALRHLATRGVTSVMLEGGPTVHAAFWDRGLVDRVQMYVVPRALGREAVAWWSTSDAVRERLHAVRSTPLGPDLLIEGDVHRVD